MAKKLTYEEVKDVFESKGNKLISTEYVNADTPLEYICDCGNLDKKRISDFKRGQRCKECKKEKLNKKSKLPFDEVKRTFEQQGNKLLSTEYINSKTPLDYICDCGKPDKKTLSNFKNGQRCKDCKRNKIGSKLKLKEEDVKKLFEENECVFIGPYINSNEPIKFICTCGKPSEKTLGHFRRESKCSECGYRKMAEEKERKYQYATQYQKLFKKEKYKMLDPYIGAKNEISVRCPKGHEYSVKPANFKTGNRCAKCVGLKKKTLEEVTNIFENEGYNVHSKEYINAFEKIEVTCPRGHDTEISWDNFRAGRRCARCNESKGEKKVFEFLTKHEITFDTQHTFDDCKYKRKLPFDFVIFDEKGEIAQLCEYDGQFHFIATEFTKGEKGLKEVQKRDKIKTDYCQKNGIPLLRIKYTEFHCIEEILEKELTHFIKTMV